MTKSPQKNVPDVGIELGAACMPSELDSDRATAPGVPSRVQFRSFELTLGAGPPLAREILKRAKSCQHHELHCLADVIFYRRLTVFQCYLLSDYAWTEQQIMQLISTFSYVYFVDVSAPLESICYLGPHAWYIKENEIKEKQKQTGTNTDTVFKESIQQIIK